MKQYKLKPGTDSRIYYLLTIKDDGTMTLYFHGTDRSLTEEASVNHDGWIVTKGAMYPPIDHPNGRWQLMADVRCQTAEVRNAENPIQCNMTQSNRGGDAEHTGDNPSVNAMLSQQGQSPCVPKPRRAVRAQKPTLSPYERLYGAPAITVDHADDHSDRNRKIFAAVATAAVFIVLVNTIGLFGIAALGLLAGGLIK